MYERNNDRRQGLFKGKKTHPPKFEVDGDHLQHPSPYMDAINLSLIRSSQSCRRSDYLLTPPSLMRVLHGLDASALSSAIDSQFTSPKASPVQSLAKV